MTGPKPPSAASLCDDGAPGRRACEVPTTCQPPSSWCKDPWPATIRAISPTGLQLTLARRFERGAGLAVELPAEGSGVSTVLARVTQIKENPNGGWVLACEFISALSEEEVQDVLRLDPLYRASLADPGAPPADRGGACVNGVLFHAEAATGEQLRWFVKRLDLSARWPLTAGQTVAFRVGAPAAGASLRLKVDSCRLFGSYWVVECRLRDVPNEDVLLALSCEAGAI
jgi:hypothetical protein